MKVSLKWLRDYVDITLTSRELAERLTMAGLEVGGIQTVGGSWDKIVVGEVVAVDPHPNADRLTLATVNLGSEQITVVCGAPNIRAGQKIAFAGVGVAHRWAHGATLGAEAGQDSRGRFQRDGLLRERAGHF